MAITLQGIFLGHDVVKVRFFRKGLKKTKKGNSAQECVFPVFERELSCKCYTNGTISCDLSEYCKDMIFYLLH